MKSDMFKCGIFTFDNLTFLFQLPFWVAGKKIISITSFPGWPTTSEEWATHICVGPGWQLAAAAKGNRGVEGLDVEPDSLGLNPTSATY